MSDPTMIAVDREVVIRAQPDTVFSFFTDDDRLSSWFGAGSSVVPEVGGAIEIRFPGGEAVAQGQILTLDPPRSIGFTWGYPGNDELPPGGSTVEITLEPVAEGTRLVLRHRFTAAKHSAAHVAGWRHHIGHLATLCTREQHHQASTIVDRWFATWREPDLDARRRLLLEAAHPEMALVEELVTVEGVDEVAEHIENARLHMPGVEHCRDGVAAMVGDMVMADWTLRHGELGMLATGRLTATVDLDSKIASVASVWTTDPEQTMMALHSGRPIAVPHEDSNPAVEPHLWTDDMADAISWYQEVLGCTVEATHPPEGDATWARLRRGRAAFMIAVTPGDRQASGNQAYLRAVRDRLDHGGPIALYLGVDDIDAAWARVQRSGAEVLEDLWGPCRGGRQLTVAGPDGVWWTLFDAGAND